MTSLPARFAFDGLAEAAARVGGRVEDDRVHLPALDVTLTPGEVYVTRETNVVSFEVVAEHPGLPAAVRFTAVGFGDDLHAAAVSAAGQWFEVVFPVMHDLYAGHESGDVSHATIAARNRSTNERFRWRVTVGPVRVVHSAAAEPPRPDDGLILRSLSREITGIAASAEPFWLDAYVAVQDDGKAIADCRLRNEPWREAGRRLRAAAEDICPVTGEGFVSCRQFLFFSPAPADAPPARKKWWPFRLW